MFINTESLVIDIKLAEKEAIEHFTENYPKFSIEKEHEIIFFENYVLARWVLIKGQPYLGLQWAVFGEESNKYRKCIGMWNAFLDYNLFKKETRSSLSYRLYASQYFDFEEIAILFELNVKRIPQMVKTGQLAVKKMDENIDFQIPISEAKKLVFLLSDIAYPNCRT